MCSLSRCLAAIVGILGFALGSPAVAQTNYTWNYSGTGWSSSSSWTPNGTPTAADTAILNVFDSTTYNLSSLSGAAAAGELAILGPRPLGTGTILGAGNTLTLGTGGTMSVAPL